MKYKVSTFGIIAVILLLHACAPSTIKRGDKLYRLKKMDGLTADAYRKTDKFLEDALVTSRPLAIHPASRIDTIIVNRESRQLDIFLNREFSFVPFREKENALLYAALGSYLGKKFRDYRVTLHGGKYPIEAMVPNYFRRDSSLHDSSRKPQNLNRGMPVVENVDRPYLPTEGLYNRNIALWPSHGWYYEHRLKRWEWQRARLFTTVEDLLPFSFVQPYLLPMLENAGATVLMPRERDLQRHEAIVDNDNDSLQTMAHGQYRVVYNRMDSTKILGADSSGFAIGAPPYGEGENPFRQGTYEKFLSDTLGHVEIIWTPQLAESGEYAVYISYANMENSVDDAEYTVYHSGGSTRFLVNQQIGGGTWIYLGTFRFEAHAPINEASVLLINSSRSGGGIITADAVRFGGGMGNVAREGQVSGRPRFVEGARYYMQFSGMPDSLVYNVTNEPDRDYVDDYRGRGEWVNYLRGAPFGPNADRESKGLGIPIDLSLAFHTDAGRSETDTTIGTLMIFSVPDGDTIDTFPDGMSRLANRDFGDILQTQIVDDIRRTYDPAWRRRGMWDKGYSEAFRPNVPAALLELLSHHNYLDMKFALDPRFRFDASRAIYKAMLRFIATQNNVNYQVQPLPVTHFSAVLENEGVRLNWRPQDDPLEPSASADQYVVYTRIGEEGFDNGQLVDGTTYFSTDVADSVIYSFKIAAVNAGGESFPSEILSVCRMPQGVGTVLIVNGFDRVAPPAAVETGEFQGFAGFWDQGVPDRYDLNYTGQQYNFGALSPWVDDDAPGHGASYADMETRVVAGNTFDFVAVHGEAIRSAGYSFVSSSDETVADGRVALSAYPVVDFLMGEEKRTWWPKDTRPPAYEVFPEDLRRQIELYCRNGGNLLISGAHIGTDLFTGRSKEDSAMVFAQEVLKYRWRTNHASKSGAVYSVDSLLLGRGYQLEFNTILSEDLYAAEAPDGIEPVDSLGFTFLRYRENNISAAVAHIGDYRVVAMGFPFETILDAAVREEMMAAVLAFLSGR